jgi:hypothetical protein
MQISRSWALAPKVLGVRYSMTALVFVLFAACQAPEQQGSPGYAGGKADQLDADGNPVGWRLHYIDHSGSGADGVDVTDVDGDGRLDITSGWTESGWVKVYFNPGKYGVYNQWPAVDVRGGLKVKGAVEDAVFADFDRDGQVDAVVSANEGNVMQVGVHWLVDRGNKLSPSAWEGTWLPGAYAFHLKATVGQIDGERGDDIVVGSMDRFLSGGKVIWFRAPPQLGPSTAYSWERFEIGSVDKITGIRVLDMDGDGDNDVLYSGTGRLRWRENPGPNAVLKKKQWEGHTLDAAGVKDVTLCDVDQDGERDIVVATTGSFDGEGDVVAAWYRRLGPSGQKWQRYLVRAEGGRPGDFAHKGVACADFDLDGRVDLALTGSNRGHGVYGVSYVGDTPRYSGTWSRWLVDRDRDEMKYDNVIAADLDGDGDDDLLTTEENVGSGSRGLGVVWFENRQPSE